MESTTTIYNTPSGKPDIEQALESVFNEDCGSAKQQLLCNEVKALSMNDAANEAVTEKELAILFLDLRNYTGLLQSQPAKEVVQVVKKLFGVFSNVINTYGGRVIDRAGDSLYAVFGLKDNIREAANQAFGAANMLFGVLDYFNDRFAFSRYGSPLEMGIGLHAGAAFIDQQQNEQGSYLSVMGLPVNIAARLQAETKILNNDFILSAEAYNLIDTRDGELIKTEQQQVRLPGVETWQAIWLAGKAYVNKKLTDNDMEYLLAIAG